jgi:hypothetical protein
MQGKHHQNILNKRDLSCDCYDKKLQSFSTTTFIHQNDLKSAHNDINVLKSMQHLLVLSAQQIPVAGRSNLQTTFRKLWISPVFLAFLFITIVLCNLPTLIRWHACIFVTDHCRKVDKSTVFAGDLQITCRPATMIFHAVVSGGTLQHALPSFTWQQKSNSKTYNIAIFLF